MINTFLRDELADLIREHGVQPRAKHSSPSTSYAWFSVNESALSPLVLDQSRRARLLRQVKRIAWKYPWGPEVIRRAMDAVDAASESDMSEPDLVQLLEELTHQDERAMHSCDDEDAPPAR